VSKNTSVFSLFPKIWVYIPSIRKFQFKILLLLSFFTSLVEMLSISSALPFVGVLMEPEKIYQNIYFHDLFEKFGFMSATDIVLPITLLFAFTILLSMLMRFILLWVNAKLSFKTGIDISIDVYNKILMQPYIFHTTKNSSEVINIVNVKVSEVIFFIIMPTLTLFTSGIMLIVMLMVLSYFLPTSVILVMFLFIVLYTIIIKFIKNRLKSNSETISVESTEIIKTLQEGLGGIRDILIDKTQPNFLSYYQRSVKSLRETQAENQIFGAAPKFFLEGIGMLLVAAFAYTLSQQLNNSLSTIPILVGVVLSIQRLLPLMQQMFQSWSLIQSSQASLKDVIEYLDLRTESNKDNKLHIIFNENIKLKNISFQYLIDSPSILSSVDLNIQKGSCIGFIGSTGSGKSTLIDIIMGLLEPTEGTISIDNQILTKDNMHLWQKLIAHVPQSIYLIDSTIEQNIAFGIDKDKIDKSLVRESAQKAQVADIIEKMPNAYDTVVGERGIQLSGGQRQRLGIARALYKNAQIIILDEATSALDNETEKAVIESFNSLGSNVTLLMIAHRITTLKDCTNIIELKDGKICKAIKYEELRKKNYDRT